jgi:Kef-type K+ transport system membrane component KefB
MDKVFMFAALIAAFVGTVFFIGSYLVPKLERWAKTQRNMEQTKPKILG